MDRPEAIEREKASTRFPSASRSTGSSRWSSSCSPWRPAPPPTPPRPGTASGWDCGESPRRQKRSSARPAGPGGTWRGGRRKAGDDGRVEGTRGNTHNNRTLRRNLAYARRFFPFSSSENSSIIHSRISVSPARLPSCSWLSVRVRGRAGEKGDRLFSNESSRQPHSPPLLHTLTGRGGCAASLEAVRPPLTIASGAAETRYILGYGPVRARASLSKSLSADFSTTTIQ